MGDSNKFRQSHHPYSPYVMNSPAVGSRKDWASKSGKLSNVYEQMVQDDSFQFQRDLMMQSNQKRQNQQEMANFLKNQMDFKMKKFSQEVDTSLKIDEMMVNRDRLNVSMHNGQLRDKHHREM
jgi:hypothetical protein